ncbi:hypothetical protein K458DRAFT_155937 [Lentithecium fluviatile CBS 122367]|uniref:Uncharacterized protein n=1 Tax=Lentithecium fluviatile CBS 122367 TaxID=1168545 RepID=A0A6G1IIG6_9PLEO|nr:hypothetical protein K458DRAFT_155937 [Lentithecium fluviatile CBS 122367]
MTCVFLKLWSTLRCMRKTPFCWGHHTHPHTAVHPSHINQPPGRARLFTASHYPRLSCLIFSRQARAAIVGFSLVAICHAVRPEGEICTHQIEVTTVGAEV